MAEHAEHRVRAIPEGMHTITPSLTIKGAAEAIEFYKKAFGATELSRAPDPSGQLIWHAHLKIGDSHLFLADEMPSMGGKGPQALGGTPVTMWCYFENVDAAFKRAVDAGAKVTMPLSDMFWGDRFGGITDPFGHNWGLAQHVKDMTPEEMQQAQEAFVKQMAGGAKP